MGRERAEAMDLIELRDTRQSGIGGIVAIHDVSSLADSAENYLGHVRAHNQEP